MQKITTAICLLVISAVAVAGDLRARDLGIPFDGQPGKYNAITDVPGVTVGQVTLIDDLDEGKAVRTGVTAILPRGRDSIETFSFAGWFTLNGNGEMTGTTWVAESGFLEKHGCELIGAKLDAIKKSEDRGLFRDAMKRIGLDVPNSVIAHTMYEVRDFGKEMNYQTVIRPAFTLGGSGAGLSFSADEFEEAVRRGLDASPVTEVLVEESVLGWKEYELEVMRDLNDNVVIICSIENLDPMGVHTGDSITVAPAQTLSR